MPRSRTTSARSSSPRQHESTGRAGASRKRSAPPAKVAPSPALPVNAANGLRVRMYRVGFGDFFLLSVPTATGLSHILIDCGVHAKDLGSMRAAVTQMANDCNNRLALVIMTHRHADHISGFGSCADIFAQIEVARVWMPWFENPANPNAAAFQASLVAMAGDLGRQFRARLAAGPDPEADQLLSMAENITGGLGIAANQRALEVLHGGFKGTQPAHDYYKAGDSPTLPPDLAAAGLTAEILGPPVDDTLIGQMTNKNQQYLAGMTESSDQPERLKPFGNAFRGKREDYGDKAFAPYGFDRMIRMLEGAQPDVLAAQAQDADKTLNNQSLVILFSFGGKTLLFAGDAQWGNWENFLYGGAYGTPGHTQLTARAQDILGKIDFYKVGHHGSANATPKDAVKAMRIGCVGMCSTQEHAYNEVPREPLLDALRQRMNDQLARSDQVAAGAEAPANPDAGPLPKAFTAPAQQLFIDYDF
ncbi:beta-lactamase superfamily II metal-dependent hydrolase [Bradyrhizobium sp. USDA 4353]